MSSTLYRRGVIDAPAAPGATALLVEGDRIVWIGREDQADGLSATTVVDLAGALVTAGFVDAHAHVLTTALAAEWLDLSTVSSVTELLAAVRTAAAGDLGHRLAAEGAPLAGSGWDEHTWPQSRPPTCTELDAAAHGAPVYLTRADAHSGVASTSFAQVLGLDRLPGWHPDGLATGAAHRAALDALTDLAPARRDRLYRAALAEAASRGIVALHEHSAPGTDTRAGLRSLLDMAHEPTLPLVLGYRGELCVTADDARELLADIPGLTGIGGDLCVDGSLGSRTAALHRPYLDPPAGWPSPAGDLELTAEVLSNHIAAVTRAGAQAAVHAVGDRAVTEVLWGVRAAADVEGLEAIRQAGHRIEHAALIDAPALAALVLCGLTVCVQPAVGPSWGGPDGEYARRLGAARAANLTPLADLHDAGVPLAFGSAAPAAAWDPWGAVRGAVDHHTVEQRLSTRAAVVAHTRGGWRAGRGGARLSQSPAVPAESVDPLAGELRVGAPAHLAMWAVEDAAWIHRGIAQHTWSRPGYRAPDPVLPELTGDVPAPVCLRAVRSGVEIFDTCR